MVSNKEMIGKFVMVIAVLSLVIGVVFSLSSNYSIVVIDFLSGLLKGFGLLLYLLLTLAAFALSVVIAVIKRLSSVLMGSIVLFAVFSFTSLYLLINGLELFILRSFWVLSVPLFIVFLRKGGIN